MANTDITEDNLLKTDLRTLWSDTLIELVCDAVKEDWSDNAIQEIIKELYYKGYKPERLMMTFEKMLGPDAATRLAKFLI